MATEREQRDRHVEASRDLTLHEAAALYQVSARTLAQHIRRGQLPAYKTRGATGREWRVTEHDLQAAGHRLRPDATSAVSTDDALVLQLRRELAAARRAADAERARADELDRRLGHSLLECGRLRAALRTATGQDDEPDEPDLDPATARRLLTALRGTSPGAVSPNRFAAPSPAAPAAAAPRPPGPAPAAS